MKSVCSRRSEPSQASMMLALVNAVAPLQNPVTLARPSDLAGSNDLLPIARLLPASCQE